ncbi:WhiB family transcriptional regulator [Streptomyces sp. NBC_01803]|uniref:WhiB family transcriptional regulator n=1 Tax=Streptomyces sp. NBC_01803 TaxID=2975946 RepID=UPI003FA36F8B
MAEQCLSWAVDVGPVEGIWGGTTEGERRAMRLRTMRRPTATATVTVTVTVTVTEAAA